jgi:hypothetical protein
MVMILVKGRSWRRLTLLAVLALLAGVAGCGGGRYAVHGRVVYEDGSPLTEGMVIGEKAEGDRRVKAQGNVKSDGTFSWGTFSPGDGAEPGKYRVVVVPRGVGEKEASQGVLPAVDPKFSNPRTSGIHFEVKAGKNELNITVTRPKQGRRGAAGRAATRAAGPVSGPVLGT